MSILALTSDTLIGTAAAGNIEYNGQFFGTDSNASRAQMQRIVLETAQATTSGTSKDFTGIPAWVKRITVMFDGVSTSGSSNLQIQLGDSGGIETTGYISVGTYLGTSTSGSSYTTGFGFLSAGSTNVLSGLVIISLLNNNTFVATGDMAGSGGAAGFRYGTSGSKTLSATLDRIRITTVTGTDTFDAGSINIMYEG